MLFHIIFISNQPSKNEELTVMLIKKGLHNVLLPRLITFVTDIVGCYCNQYELHYCTYCNIILLLTIYYIVINNIVLFFISIDTDTINKLPWIKNFE